MNKEKSEPHTNNTYVENYTNFFEINNYTNCIDNFSENKSSFIKIGDIYVLLAFIGTFFIQLLWVSKMKLNILKKRN